MKLHSQAFLPSVLSYKIGGKEGPGLPCLKSYTIGGKEGLDEATGDHHGRTVMCKLV